MRNAITFVFICFFLSGVYWLQCWYLIHEQWQLASNLILKPVQVTGVIASTPENKFHGLHFLLNVKTFQGKAISTNMLIHWYQDPPPLQVGQSWELWVRLKPP